jgi:molybdopterin converting factor subunit 1
MRIRVKLFAIIRERAGVDELALELRDGADVAALAAAMKEKYPTIATFVERSAFAVNREYAAAATVLRDGDEVAVIPPVSGG